MVCEGKNHIAGRWVATEDREMLEQRNPACLSEITSRFPIGTADDVDRAVSAARKALPTWADTSPKKRTDILKRAQANLEDRRE